MNPWDIALPVVVFLGVFALLNAIGSLFGIGIWA